MKQLLVLFCLTISFTAFIFPTENKDFDMWIEQDGKKIKMEDNSCTIDKKPFKIVFSLKDSTGVLVNTSFDEKSYKQAKSGMDINKVKGYTETGMAEGKFNEGKDVFIDDLAPSYWYYDGKDDNRFDEVVNENNALICKRTINNFWISSDNIIKVEDSKEQNLYLVAHTYEWSKDYSKRIEFVRKYIKITFK